jgi:predicted PurR-regulated permease PerM
MSAVIPCPPALESSGLREGQWVGDASGAARSGDAAASNGDGTTPSTRARSTRSPSGSRRRIQARPIEVPDLAAASAPAAADAPPAEAAASIIPAGSDLPAGGPGAPRSVRFASLRVPSAPFWVVLVGGLIAGTAILVAAPALLVFGVGVALAFFLIPVADWLERHRVPRVLAAIIVVVVTLGAAVGGILMSLFIVVEQGVAFVQALPGYMAGIRADIEALALPAWLKTGLDAVGASIDGTLGTVDWGTVAIGLAHRLLGLLGFFLSFGLLPFFLFFLVKDQPQMRRDFHAGVPAAWEADVERILTILGRNTAQYVKGGIIVGSIMFVTVTLGMTLIGNNVPGGQVLSSFALFLGLVAFVMEAIPQIGPILSYVPALILALTAGIEAVVVVSIFYFVIFNIEGSILVPAFQGKLISFRGATVLVLVAMGFALGGIIGAIVALPVAAIGRDLFRLFFERAVEEASLPIEPTLAAAVAPVPARSGS